MDRFLSVFAPFTTQRPPASIASNLTPQERRAYLDFAKLFFFKSRMAGDAEQIWNWIKAEANDLSNLTKVDIQEMIANRNMSDEVLALVTRSYLTFLWVRYSALLTRTGTGTKVQIGFVQQQLRVTGRQSMTFSLWTLQSCT